MSEVSIKLEGLLQEVIDKYLKDFPANDTQNRMTLQYQCNTLLRNYTNEAGDIFVKREDGSTHKLIGFEVHSDAPEKVSVEAVYRKLSFNMVI